MRKKFWHGQDPILWFAIFFAATLTAGLGILRYQGYNSGMLDLGNMAQAISSATRGEPLVYTSAYGSFSRLAGHFELIYFLIALFYRFLPNPQVLLVLQAVLFACGAIPLYRIALRHIQERFAARCIALIYLAYPTALSSVLFDFHGDTLAMPLLLFLIDALDQKAWRRYSILLVLVLMCKIYLAIPIAGIGFYLWMWGQEKRIGLITMISAVLYGVIAFFIIRPMFAMEIQVEGQGISGYVGQYFGRFSELLSTSFDRLLSVIVVFGPVALFLWRGWRWLVPAAPAAIATLISTGPGGVYDYRYHHYATIVPFIMMAVVVGVASRKQAESIKTKRGGRNWWGDLGLTTAITLIFTCLLVNIPLNPFFWINGPGTQSYGLNPSSYGVIERDHMKDAFIQRIPDSAPIMASNQISVHLTNRDTLYLLRYPHESEMPERLDANISAVDYVIGDALFDIYIPIEGGYGGGLDGERGAISKVFEHPEFGLVDMRDGLLLFQRNPPQSSQLKNELQFLADNGQTPIFTFSDFVSLVEQDIEVLSDRRLRVQFTWRVDKPFNRGARYVAVSRLEGLENARFVHLPSYIFHPAWQWETGQLIHEDFEVLLPEDTQPGEYTWKLGWYHVGTPYSYATDQRSRLPNSDEVSIGPVTIP